MLNASRIRFWGDHLAGANEGVAPPRGWHLEYWDRGWRRVPRANSYGTVPDVWQTVRFPALTTRCLHAVFDASGRAGRFSGLAVQEWEALAPHAALPATSTPPVTTPCDQPAK